MAIETSAIQVLIYGLCVRISHIAKATELEPSESYGFDLAISFESLLEALDFWIVS